LASGSAPLGQLRQVTRTAPIVFALVVDPVGAGFLDSLAQPGGIATGYILFEYSLSGNAWYCSSRSRLACRERRLFEIPP
jgi:putative tryptophan/tyrosine transport system substrate-binding protein